MKNNKIQHYLLCCRGCRGEGNLSFNFKFEILDSGSDVLVVYSEVTVVH
jgi:hypothetical protein